MGTAVSWINVAFLVVSICEKRNKNATTNDDADDDDEYGDD